MKKIIIAVMSAIAVVMAMTLPAGASSPASHYRSHVFSSTGIHIFPVRSHAAVGRFGTGNLTYHGGPVQTNPRIYLVFWGQWWHSGCAGQQGHGVADQNYLTAYFNGRGVGSDGLANTMTQYGTPTANRSQFGHKVLYGSAVDCTNPPHAATQAQLAAEAVKYANHFKALGQPINTNTQIVVVSPSGTNPGGGFGTQYCAWHSVTAFGSVGLTYTNDPYMPDAGANCGANFIKGPLDGWSIVAGHEFSETVNDPQLSAWWDSQGNENGDKCAWGGVFVQNLPTGQFPEQPEWNNAGSNCGQSDLVFITNPGAKSTRVNHAVSLQISAHSTAVDCNIPDPNNFGCGAYFTVHRSVHFSATGLPAGLHISSSGLITGTATVKAIYHPHVTATEAVTTVHNTTVFTWTITS